MGFKAPLISMVMVAFLVSLTGLPPTVGFYGKYLLFIEGVDNGLMWLVVIAALNSVVSLFYYLRVARALFLSKASDQEAAPAPVLTGFVAVLGVATVALGVYVSPLQHWGDQEPRPDPQRHGLLSPATALPSGPALRTPDRGEERGPRD
jgi:NADH-quinone oxidoreductase subunit N